ncbi:beta-glucosidase [Kibdelosporangium banguiense]|uniref:Beta-glucosidase n=1 Tax=Kibdelosporangium banguiense TaxID=1365924 RepID=A0ABS4TR99_9PSEU|nr:glycoside hydrolase family 3 C-terminal domain-containing protein [Kibdelosporangium banguiense]MBP2326943.1 beta-glucosidase [Kibdelosporangium banguiense]
MSETLEDHLGTLVGKLDLEQKIRLLTGASHWGVHDEPAVGLRAMTLSDGPAGVRGPEWADGSPSACLPCPTALAASWDVGLVAGMGEVLADEAVRKGVDVVLSPNVNLQRSPLAGRHFECLSEDPLLTGALGAALVGALQEHGVAATMKHYVANDSETERFSVDVRLDERTLREVYLAPFEEITRTAAPWLFMAAYNAVNGTTMTEHPLLDDPARAEWGFDGVVVSDWRAARSVAAAAAGLDLIMPGPDGPWGDALRRAVEAGEIAESAVDVKVRNLLRLAARVGALDSVAVTRPMPRVDDVRSRLRNAAAEGTVLLHNKGAVLPLADVRRVAVIGELAWHPRIQGGGSAEVRPAHVTSPFAGIRVALPDEVEVTYAAGSYLEGDPPPLPAAMLRGAEGERSVRVRWFDEAGHEVSTETRDEGELVRLGAQVPTGIREVELTTRLVPDVSGHWELGIRGAGWITFEVGGRRLLDEQVVPTHDGPGADILTPPVRTFDVELTAGQPVELRLHQRIPSSGVAVTLTGRPPRGTPEEERAAACRDAAAADVAVVVVGTSSQFESEGFDRADLNLPPGQDELVRAVAAANPNTVVVVNAGAPVLLPWRDEVAAVLVTWFGGQEVGHALADVLIGRSEPGGRLPMTWPVRTGDVPVLDTRPVDNLLAYEEGVHIGYRAWLRASTEPAYPFGHGLGYTTWELTETRSQVTQDGAVITVTVRNTGDRPGKQVVQVYLARPDSAVDRPARWLAGFTVVHVDPQGTIEVDIPVTLSAFRHWAGGWVVEPGVFDVLVGFSATEIHGTTSAEMPAGIRPGGSTNQVPPPGQR